MKSIPFITLLFISYYAFPQKVEQNNFWNISDKGGIVWNVMNEKRLPHGDNIEMSGTKVSAIIDYKINKNRQLVITRDIIYPQLRTYDKTNGTNWQEYRAYRRMTYSSEIEPNITGNAKHLIFDKLDSVRIDGKLIFYHTPVNDIALTRTLFPSMSERLFVEKWEMTNKSKNNQHLQIGNTGFSAQISGHKGIYHNKVYSDAADTVNIAPGESYCFAIYFSAALNDEPIDGHNYEIVEKERDTFLQAMQENLVLETNNPVLDKLFYFSKIRASESIFDSKMGLVHSPGGGNYYLGIWANDQIEYSGPFFPFLGYNTGIIAAKNAYSMFLKHIPEENIPIPYSFEIEGDVPPSMKDRGDAAMIAYGTSLYLLRVADKNTAKELWPLIEWSIEYCHKQLSEKGVVRSQTDEMEGRISTGDANLATSALYYGGLKYASSLALELGYTDLSKTYIKRYRELEKNIEAHFGYTMEGLNTYRYFEGNEQLRHWICLPLVMGINTRAEATATALLDKLWTENGVLVELNPGSRNSKVFWDRGTLYALRGTFKAGYFDKSLVKFTAFSNNRLLGEHVPYVIEAYPENNMRHLSAESALYCRVFIEGMLGFEQTGFSTFSINPNLNQDLSTLNLKNLHIGNHKISIELRLINNEIRTKIFSNGKIIVNSMQKRGDKVEVTLQ